MNDDGGFYLEAELYKRQTWKMRKNIWCWLCLV